MSHCINIKASKQIFLCNECKCFHNLLFFSMHFFSKFSFSSSFSPSSYLSSSIQVVTNEYTLMIMMTMMVLLSIQIIIYGRWHFQVINTNFSLHYILITVFTVYFCISTLIVCVINFNLVVLAQVNSEITSLPSTTNLTSPSIVPSSSSGSVTKKIIVPMDQFDKNHSVNQTEPPVIIHYVDFNLTENYNTSHDVYVVRNNDTENGSVNLFDNDSNETLIDRGEQVIHNFYTKVTHLTDSMDTNVLYSLWIPFVSGFAAGLTLLCTVFCCRFCCRRVCCRKRPKVNSIKRGSKKIQSLDDNRYLLVSNHSDSEGV
uniref:Uncharacterized protein n=1 Tax=Tetranychus urticae TaxID=32264 RepID=T1JTE1_TETUR